MRTFEIQDRAATRCILGFVFVISPLVFTFLVSRLEALELRWINDNLLAGGLSGAFLITIAVILIELHRNYYWKIFLRRHNVSGVWIAKDSVREEREARETGVQQPESEGEPEFWRVKRPMAGDVMYHLIETRQTLYSISFSGSAFVYDSVWHNGFLADVDGVPSDKKRQFSDSTCGVLDDCNHFYVSRHAIWKRFISKFPFGSAVVPGPAKGGGQDSERDCGEIKEFCKETEGDLLPYPPVEDEWWSTSSQISEYAKHLVISYEVARADNHPRQASTRGTMKFSTHASGKRGKQSPTWMTGQYYGFDGEHRILFGSLELRRFSGVPRVLARFNSELPLFYSVVKLLSYFFVAMFGNPRNLIRVIKGEPPKSKYLPERMRADAEAMRRFQKIRKHGLLCAPTLKYLHDNPERLWITSSDDLLSCLRCNLIEWAKEHAPSPPARSEKVSSEYGA